MTERSERRILLGILLAALALRLPWMFESLWFDETYTSKKVLGTLTLLLKTLYSDIHPPAYYVGMYGWTNVFGDSEFALRTPPLLCGLATIWLAYAVARQFLDGRTGLIAAALIAVAPVHIWYSTEARPYSTQLALLMLSVFAFGKLQEREVAQGWRWRWIYALALSTLVFTHYYMAAYAVAFGTLAFFDRTLPARRWTLGASVTALVAMLGYVAIKLWTSELETERSYLRAFTLGEWWRLFFDWFLCGHSLTPEGVTEHAWLRAAALRVFQVAAGFAFALGVWRLCKRSAHAMPRWHLIAHMAWLPLFLLALTILGFDKSFIERSALPAYPFFILVVAAGLSRGGTKAVSVVFFAMQSAATVLFFCASDHPTVYRPNPDWRAAADYFADELAAGNQDARIYTPYASPDALTYYDERLQQGRLFERDDARAQRLLSSLPADRFPGSLLHGLVARMIDEFENNKRVAKEAMRMRIEQITHHDPLTVEPARRGTPFYVIYPGDYEHPDMSEILADSSVEEVERQSWRWLRLHKFRYSN